MPGEIPRREAEKAGEDSKDWEEKSSSIPEAANSTDFRAAVDTRDILRQPLRHLLSILQ
jgi:hypothetical protein